MHIITVKDLRTALKEYPDNFLVIGICQTEEGKGHIKTVEIEQAKGSCDGKDIEMPVLHVVLDKNAAIGMTANGFALLAEKAAH
jgi:hypothetical protein